MDDMPQQPGPGDLTLGLTCPIYEDVDATLAQFVRLTRLGATTEAYALTTPLLEHLYFFPVFAELAMFYVSMGDEPSAFRLARYAADHNELREDDKRMLVGTISLFAEGKLELAAVDALQPPARRTRQTRDHLDHLGNFSMYRACNISVESIDQVSIEIIWYSLVNVSTADPDGQHAPSISTPTCLASGRSHQVYQTEHSVERIQTKARKGGCDIHTRLPESPYRE